MNQDNTNNTISVEFQLLGGEPSFIQYLGQGIQPNMETCAQLVAKFLVQDDVEWLNFEVEETDGFTYRIRTIFANDEAVSSFDVAAEDAENPRLKERLQEFSLVFARFHAHSATIH